MIGRRSSPSTQDEVKPKGFDDFELRLGDVMRGERATLAKSLLDVQRELRIKAAYVAAIEAGDIAAFETPSFIAGYVRSYARYLGLDPDWAFARFCHESGWEPTHGMSAAASGPRPQRRPNDVAEALANPNAAFVPKRDAFWTRIEPRALGSVMVLALLAGSIGYGGWTVLQEVQRVQLAPVDQAPGVVADLDPLAAVQAAPTETAGLDALPALPAPEGLDRIYRPAALDKPVLIARDGPIAAIDPNSTGLLAGASPDPAVGPAPSLAPQAQGQAFAAASLPGEGAGVRALGEGAPEVVVMAVRPSWVRIKAADGATLFEKVMDAGESYAIPRLEAAPVMRTGESGAIYFAVNGAIHGPVGKRGEVTRNIELSAAAIGGKYPPARVAEDDALAKMVAVADAGALAETPARDGSQ